MPPAIAIIMQINLPRLSTIIGLATVAALVWGVISMASGAVDTATAATNGRHAQIAAIAE